MATVAFIGLGNMGGPMATNLVNAGHEVTVFDLVPEACAQLAEAGAAVDAGRLPDQGSSGSAPAKHRRAQQTRKGSSSEGKTNTDSAGERDSPRIRHKT